MPVYLDYKLMPLLRLVAGAALLALCFLQMPHAFAQTPVEAEKLSNQLDKLATELGTARINLIQMAAGLPPDEAEYVNFILDRTASADSAIQSTWMLTNIYSLMIHPKDREIIRRFLSVQAKFTLESSDSAVKYINQSLPKIKSPAVIEEVKKLRDIFQRSREEISRVVQGA